MVIGYARRLGGRLHVGDVGLQLCLALVLDRTDANDRHDRQDGTAHHRFLEVLGVVFRERRNLLLKETSF